MSTLSKAIYRFNVIIKIPMSPFTKIGKSYKVHKESQQLQLTAEIKWNNNNSGRYKGECGKGSVGSRSQRGERAVGTKRHELAQR